MPQKSVEWCCPVISKQFSNTEGSKPKQLTIKKINYITSNHYQHNTSTFAPKPSLKQPHLFVAISKNLKLNRPVLISWLYQLGN